MPVIAVMYPSAGGATFDESYYMENHVPLVQRHWSSRGLESVQVLRGVGGPDGAAPTYMIMALLTFASMEAFSAAARSPEGREIFDDIPNFTTAKPLVQINEQVS